MNTTKVYLKSNPTSKSKLNNKRTKLYNSLFTIIAKRERERKRDNSDISVGCNRIDIYIYIRIC